jgi:hypothetical protein
MSSFRRFKITSITKNSQGFYLLSGIINGGMQVKNAKLLHVIKKPVINDIAYVYDYEYESKSWCIAQKPTGLIELIVNEINVMRNIEKEREEDIKRITAIQDSFNGLKTLFTSFSSLFTQLQTIPELASAIANLSSSISTITTTNALLTIKDTEITTSKLTSNQLKGEFNSTFE